MQPPAKPQRGIGVGELAGDGADRMIGHREPRRHARPGEAAARRAIPRHRGPGPVPVGALLHVQGRVIPAQRDRHVDVGHADLVAVVQHGGAGQGRQHEQREPDLALVAAAPAAREPAQVVVGGHPHRARAGRQRGQRLRHDHRQPRWVKGGEGEAEVESELQLIVVAVVGGQPFGLGDPRLAEQQPRGGGGGRDSIIYEITISSFMEKFPI